jgi:hypothetical protein
MDPVRAGLVDLVRAAARRRLPTLGVCLGHQAVGLAFGARLVETTPAHGKPGVVRFGGSRLFATPAGGLLEVMRYHSLSLVDVVPPLEVVARLEDGRVMAVEHRSLPIAGVQFHPDSFGTPGGRALVDSFFRRAWSGNQAPGREEERPQPMDGEAPAGPGALRSSRADHGEAPRRNRPSRSERPHDDARPLELSSLLTRDDFALLSPAYAGGRHWTLLEDLTPGGGDLVVCEAESRTPLWLGGRARAVSLEVDVPPASLEPRLEEEGFLDAVAEVRRAIAQGDVYQVNVTRRAILGDVDGASLLSTVCRLEVPRFAAWVKVRGVGELVTASPELLVERLGRTVRMEPMKGTAPPEKRLELEQSAKDAAELAMITDLVRDDLQPLCTPGTVRVVEPRRFITLPYALQTVSVVEGQLLEGIDLDEIVRRVHPGGSVTGAPREAALAMIRRLESSPRRFYCGLLGLQSPDGLRAALLIRTAWREPDGWRWGVGGGITWDSDPDRELLELRLKLGALR